VNAVIVKSLPFRKITTNMQWKRFTLLWKMRFMSML